MAVNKVVVNDQTVVDLTGDTVTPASLLRGVTATDASGTPIIGTLGRGIPYGTVDSTSTATAFTATVPGITELTDGVAVMLKNGVVTSATGFTVNVNGLGAYPVYSNMAPATRETTIFNISYTLLFVFDSTRVEGGCWINYRGYYSDANSIGYQLRTNSSSLPASDKFYRYRLLFTSADGEKWVPANTSTSTNATAKRDTNQRPIDPFGPIVYYGSTTAIDAGTAPGATALWQQYAITLGYSFNRAGAALTMSYPASVYVKCSPQTDGSVIMNAATPYVQALPSAEDGFVYIYLGRAYSATNVELVMTHPVYYFKDGAIRLWTNPQAVPTKTSDLTNDSGYITGYTETDPTVPAWAKASSKPAYTATEVGAQPTLVSGTNIKTINNESLLGSGNITIQGGGSATAMTEAEIQAAFDEGWPTLTGYILTLSLVSPIHTSAAYTPCVTIDQYSSINVDEYGQYVDVIDGATIEVSDPTISNASFTLDPTAVAFTVAPQGTYPTQSPSWGVTCTGGVAQVGFSMGQNKFTITADGTLTISGIDYDND